jgi:hypothetical protein
MHCWITSQRSARTTRDLPGHDLTQTDARLRFGPLVKQSPTTRQKKMLMPKRYCSQLTPAHCPNHV